MNITPMQAQIIMLQLFLILTKHIPFMRRKELWVMFIKTQQWKQFPLYEYFSDELNDHYASTIPNIPTLFSRLETC